MTELSIAQKRKLVKELKGASKLHLKQAIQIEKSLKKTKSKK
jgi:hypothetical protein|tara:strand:+ start:1267 stop:1392 length:126 start_codon:yes stop_codon:yes gene_type:complete